MNTRTSHSSQRSFGLRLRRSARTALTLSACALAFAGLVFTASEASAATLTVNQCNNVGPSAMGATTAMTCTVTVVNTISGGTSSSTTTVTRQCLLGPCPPGNGTFTTHSTSLVTLVTQCNGSDNDSAHPITCRVTITNNISADTPGATPVTAATSNQCVGSGTGGGGTVDCDPFPATTTGATVTQCNGSGNGGGGTVRCTVGSTSKISPAIPITVNQCNGTGNPGGSVVTCDTRIVTNITAAVPKPTATASSTGQVSQVPSGGVQAGDGSTVGLRHVGLLWLAAALLLAAVFSFEIRRSHARGAKRSH